MIFPPSQGVDAWSEIGLGREAPCRLVAVRAGKKPGFFLFRRRQGCPRFVAAGGGADVAIDRNPDPHEFRPIPVCVLSLPYAEAITCPFGITYPRPLHQVVFNLPRRENRQSFLRKRRIEFGKARYPLEHRLCFALVPSCQPDEPHVVAGVGEHRNIRYREFFNFSFRHLRRTPLSKIPSGSLVRRQCHRTRGSADCVAGQIEASKELGELGVTYLRRPARPTGGRRFFHTSQRW